MDSQEPSKETPDTSILHEDANPTITQTPQNKKLNIIKISSCGIKGSLRKNVYKYIVRKCLKMISTNPSHYSDYSKDFTGMTQEEFAEMRHKFRIVEAQEKRRETKTVHKDYCHLINMLTEDINNVSVFNLMLYELLMDFSESKTHRISDSNIGIYKQIIGALYETTRKMLL